MTDAKVLVEVTRSSNIPVCFKDCVEKVCRDDHDMNASAVLDVSRGSWLGSWITSANCDTVPY
jgi:hypothetical protein